MKRGEFVSELLAIWECSAAKLESEDYIGASGQIRTAIAVLEKTYTENELEEVV